jgi:clumping factor A
VADESADTEVLDRVPGDAEVSATGDPYADFHRQQAAAVHRDHAGADRSRPAAGEPATPEAADAVPAARDAAARDAVSGDRDVDAYGAGEVRARGGQPPDDLDATDEEDPADEPAPQRTQPADAVRVSRMVAEVLVVDGRPRYHLGDCPSLSGRITEPLPVAEAVELGFTPCSMCRPVDRLVAEAVPR